jgi:imidazolonepropionase-like amidohydrolase
MAASERMIIRPGSLLDVVTGELLAERAVVVEGDRIVQVTGAGDAPAEGPAVLDLPEHALLPGLIDCHSHLVGEPDDGQARP